MEQSMIFDQPHYTDLNNAREAVLRDIISFVEKDVKLRSAIDVGCGVGYFSNILKSFNLKVVALDGRAENVEAAKLRVPDVDFRVANAEDVAVRSFGKFDLMLCFGLLYHLENPFSAFRNLFELTGKIAVLEGMCLPGDEAIFEVRDEGPTEDQGLRHIALYPTENCMVKLLYRSGFSFVYRFRTPPHHPAYTVSRDRRRSRTMLVASTTAVSSDMLFLAPEPVTNPDTWVIKTVAKTVRRSLSRAKRFLMKTTRVTT